MEKFALLDFLKAFQSFIPPSTPEQTNVGGNAPAPEKSVTPEQNLDFNVNVMANVLARHEEIANRIKNKNNS